MCSLTWTRKSTMLDEAEAKLLTHMRHSTTTASWNTPSAVTAKLTMPVLASMATFSG